MFGTVIIADIKRGLCKIYGESKKEKKKHYRKKKEEIKD